jgi:cytochrome c553
MRRVLMFFVLCCLSLTSIAVNLDGKPPDWAYVINPPSTVSSQPPDQQTHHVPNSNEAFTTSQTQDLFTVPDWHPADHPPMPEIVSHGRKPEVYACGYCHLPNGLGRPENASLAGLSASYIVHQVTDFRSGARKSSEPRHLPTTNMITYETKATRQEIAAAARYFAGLPRKSWIRVIETSTVPKTHISGWMLVADNPAATEPIGQRIIEIPEDLQRTELRDDTSGFIAYVPEGSLKKGKELVTMGGDGKTPCAKCHGAGLHGDGNIPSIAGRSPSYVIRQMFDIQSGARSGAGSLQMRRQVGKLTVDDMIAIAAFSASLKP